MALDFPAHFPESYRLPVIAIEASARSTLNLRLREIDRSWAPGRGYFMDREAIMGPVVEYLCTVARAFSEQACLAVRAKQYPATSLDAAVEGSRVSGGGAVRPRCRR
jgi:hypothetical protein